MNNTNKLKSILERDIDLLLLEEFNVSEHFCSWLYSKIFNENSAPPCKGAWHSISDDLLGESDLVVLFENGKCVLVENKIDAVAQPKQGQRYKQRGVKGISQNLWSAFSTCMVAPELYLQTEIDSQSYDINISYEEIYDWFVDSPNQTKREKYKAYVIKEAIEQNRRGYQIIPDEKVTNFWFEYWQLSNKMYPHLEMKKPGNKPFNSDWPEFRPSALNKNIVIVHKLERGDVDLQISGAANKLEIIKSLIDESKFAVVKAGKSAAIRLKVDRINRLADFESQVESVSIGLTAAMELLEIAREIQRKF